ncbi:glycosyl hydrolase all-beta [Lucifera butyrica]|uniref:Glycosyl hydrolase all-beta n=1 Tax=Lucifera butyrica TaxID=1351585 RepID=A0A498R2V7_9FIRM|nr:glycoside hydrolase family 30 beta sandwich domain-containing protein [Lucifera butyrica]VBB05721.1 glycosyl hydrolase all-beta [Lucifera butyrica]
MTLENIRWIGTAPDAAWTDNAVMAAASSEDTLALTGERGQNIGGFGGCFNELGWIALSRIEPAARERVLRDLFHPQLGCKFNYCRLPIGANDYALDWYSCNETDGDYAMEKFSIDRDKLYLLPYIKKALEYRADLTLYASPWSPPTWMKEPRVYNYGKLRMEPEVLKAYALYFKKFVKAYEQEGIRIRQIHIQNEPFADQKFPSCLWTGEQYRVFIRDYLGPLFQKENMAAEIWFGTLNGPTPMAMNPLTGAITLQSYDAYVDHVLFDPEARKYIKGVGYQWAGKYAIQRTHDSFPELKLIQTENECGDGQNSWEYARYVFDLIRHYLVNGANAYIYWNMVLEPGGVSTWGWPQNSLITIDAETQKVIYNPEFYLMKHFSHFVAPGAARLLTKGHWNSASLAFENPNGEIVLVVNNGVAYSRTFTFKGNQRAFSAELRPYSFNTFVL